MKIFKSKFILTESRAIDHFLALTAKPVTLKIMMAVAMVLFCTVDMLAQSNGAGFSSATTTIQGYQSQVSSLMKAIGAIIAIVGAFNVFFKMQNGDQDVKKTIMLTIGGCVAFVALGEALPMFFE